MSHDHSHAVHDHAHASAPGSAASASEQRAFALGVGLNLAFCIAEALIGWMFNSVALLADAAHNLTDVIGLVLAWMAAVAAMWRGSGRFTYGLRKLSVMVAFINGAILIVSCVLLTWESVTRFLHPQSTPAWPMIWTALVGIAINGYTAWLFTKGRKDDINIRGAFLHLAADALVSLGVVLSGVAILLTHVQWIDPLAGLLVVGVILQSAWRLFGESIMQMFDAAPRQIDLPAVREFLARQPGVVTVHDLHVWNIGTNLTALTAHLVSRDVVETTSRLHEIAHELEEHHGIGHPTIQVEPETLECHSRECGPEPRN